MKTPRAAALLATLCCSAPAAAELLWPLQQAESEKALSSSFCEDRGSHLHGGVDMSTGGEVGLPVVAVADGAITRVKVKYRGLGRAVYVSHPGGLMTVYGHLAGFAEPVRSQVDALIGRKGLYPGDWFPEEPIPVKAGQVIAWSGKTGGGPPHLHFETRRSGGNRPVDPWAEGLPCIDRQAPVIDAVALLPEPARWLQEPSGRVERIDELERPLRIPAGQRLAVRVRDPFRAGTGSIRFLEARLGEQLLVRLDAAAYTYSVTKYAGFWHLRGGPLGEGRANWAWLGKLPGNGLPFVEGVAAPADLLTGEATLTVVARDGCGNETRMSWPVVVEPHAERLPLPPRDPLRPDFAGAFATYPPGTGSGAPGGAKSLTFGSATPEHGGGRHSADSYLPLEIPAGALGENARLSALADPDSLPWPPDRRLVRHGHLRLGPEWLPLRSKARVRFPLRGAPDAAAVERLGVYYWSPDSESWQFWGDNLRDATSLGTTTDRLGLFALLEDASPPRVASIARRSVRERPWRAAADELVVRYEEIGEGVSWDGVRFRPAGRDEVWIADHDPDLDEGAFVLPEELAGKRLTGTLLLEDLAGHLVEIAVDSKP